MGMPFVQTGVLLRQDGAMSVASNVCWCVPGVAVLFEVCWCVEAWGEGDDSEEV